YGHEESGKPLTPSGAAQAYLATKVHDGRENAMTFAYCLADGGGYTAEVAIDSIQYTSFEGKPALPATRAVEFVYALKDLGDQRTSYAGGMALQRSLRLDEVDMVLDPDGPQSTLVRRYALTYGLGPTTGRTLL